VWPTATNMSSTAVLEIASSDLICVSWAENESEDSLCSKSKLATDKNDSIFGGETRCSTWKGRRSFFIKVTLVPSSNWFASQAET
jgi:hypothetical protein